MPTHCHHHQSMVSSDARLVLVRHALSTYSLSTSQAVATSADNRSDSANNTPPPFIHLDGTEKRGTFAELLSTSTIHLHVQPKAGTHHLSSVTTSLASMIRFDTITYDTYIHDTGYTNLGLHDTGHIVWHDSTWRRSRRRIEKVRERRSAEPLGTLQRTARGNRRARR